MDEIRIGVVSITLGPYAAMGKDGFRGAELALAQFGGMIAGKRIRLIEHGSNALPDSAVYATQHLLDEDGCALVVGPMSGDEGLGVRDFAKKRPETTFLNGLAAAHDITLRGGAPNFFSFNTNGVQFSAGLAEYAIQTHGYRRVVTLGEDYSYPYAQVGAFMVEFCRAGGQVVDKLWVPLGKIDFSDIIRTIPEGIDAIYVCLAGADAVNFIQQYAKAGGRKPIIGGSVLVDQAVLSANDALASALEGTIWSGPVAENNPAAHWQLFVGDYQARFPNGLPSPSMFCNGYYTNMKAALLALSAINADLSDGQARFREVLARLEFVSPTGPVRLDHHQHAIGNNFVMELVRNANGKLVNRLVKTITNVSQTLGMSEEEFLSLGTFTHHNPPACNGVLPS